MQKIDLGLTGYDELFANDEERKVNKLPRIFDIPISEIDDFPDHPFKVKIDEDILAYENEARYPGEVIKLKSFEVQGVARHVIKAL